MTHTHSEATATHDLSALAAQQQHYAAVRARLGHVQTVAVVRRPTPPPAPYKPAPVVHREPHDYLFVRTDLTHKGTARMRGIWNTVSANRIIAEVSAKRCISIERMRGETRSKPVVAARHEAYYRISTELGYSLPMIGKAMGGKEHTGVMHGIRKHKERMEAGTV